MSSSMSGFDEPYDADGDVSRFLLCPSSPDAQLFSLSEPVGLSQYAAPAPATTDHDVQGHHQAPPQTTLNAAAPADPSGHLQVPATESQGLHQAPQITGFHGHHHPAPQTLLGVAPDFGLQQQQAPITAGFQGHHHPAPPTLMGVVPDFGLQQQQQAPITAGFQGHHHSAPQTLALITGFQGHHPALQTLNAAPDFGGPSAPAIDATTMMDVDYYPPMAMDNIIQAPTQTTMPAPETHHHHAHGGGGGFPPNPAPMHSDPDPNDSELYRLLLSQGEVELAAIIRDIERGDNAAAGAGAGAAGAARLNDVHPVKEEVFFRAIKPGQLDCSRRCRSVREVVCQDERRRMHLMVHASDPGTIYQHALVHRMSVRADGHLHTDVLLHHDLRGRNPEWVQNFIAHSVEMMQRNGGQMQDTSSSSYTNIVTAPLPRHRLHMRHPAASTTSGAQQPTVTQEQGNTNNNAVLLPEAGAAAPEAAQPAVPEGAQRAVVTAVPRQPENNTGAPAASRVAGSVFASFNWEGFQPEILGSSLVQPYDPESGVNVLMYPSLAEQQRQSELARNESKRLSKMPAQDPAAYLEMMSGEDDPANEPKLGSSAPFRRLCQRDATYRLYSRRVNTIHRKITKLQNSAARVGVKGMFGLKRKMDTYRREKADLYYMINRAMEENERRGDDGAGPSNRAGTSNTAAPSGGAGPSNTAAGPSNCVGAAAAAGGPSDTAIVLYSDDSTAADTSDDADPSDDAAIPSSDGAGTSNDE